MKQFLAIYIGTAAAREKSGWDSLDEATRAERQRVGIGEWMKWGEVNKDRIVDVGTPLGRTKHISKDGVADVKNELVGYVVIRAESHEAAARLFEGHPHFTIFPGDSIEVMECLPLPGAQSS